MLVCGGGYIIAYHTYGRFLAGRDIQLKRAKNEMVKLIKASRQTVEALEMSIFLLLLPIGKTPIRLLAQRHRNQ